MFGSGGIFAELLKDVTLRLHPITDTDAAEMVASLKMSRIFEGYRGARRPAIPRQYRNYC